MSNGAKEPGITPKPSHREQNRRRSNRSAALEKIAPMKQVSSD